jgi:hypothetical protein
MLSDEEVDMMGLLKLLEIKKKFQLYDLLFELRELLKLYKKND